jgi:hypothetical protein
MYMNRKAMEFWGKNPAPNVAAMVSDYPGHYRLITWGDVMENRRKRQAEQLLRIRALESARQEFYRVWVAYFDQSLMGGWQAFIDSRRTFNHYGNWIDRDRRWLKPMLMEAFPLLLPLGSEHERWEAWKPEFAAQYSRGQQDGRPRGCCFVRWNGKDVPDPIETPVSAKYPQWLISCSD